MCSRMPASTASRCAMIVSSRSKSTTGAVMIARSPSATTQEARAVVHEREGALGPRRGLLRTDGEQPVELGRVFEELERAIANRRDPFDDDLCELLLEVAVAAAGVLRLEVADGRVDAEEVGDAGLRLGVEADLAFGVGDGALEFLRGDLGVVEEVHEPRRGHGRLGHLRGRLLQVVDAGRLRGDHRLGNGEGVAESRVEAPREVARELEVLAL